MRKTSLQGRPGSRRHGWTAAVTAAAFLLVLAGVPDSTTAYTISTLASPGCHEKMTSEALRAVRLDLPAAGPLALTRDERAFVDDLDFHPPGDMEDLGGVTLLVSVRDNDLKGRASDDLSLLGTVHGNPNNQDEHCLRSADQDEPDGSAAAVAACRLFIRERVREALDGLGADGAPSLASRAALRLHLPLRGGIDVSLPTYYVRIGQAIHALEDSFSHTYRTADGKQVTVVANWIDLANKTLVESRDGPAHAGAMDACDDPDELRTTRRVLATEATAAMLRATLGPGTTKEEKMAAVDGLLDTYLGYSPGCTFDNHWCDAPERQFKDKATSAFGCASGGAGVLGGVGALLALTFLTRRRRTTSLVAVLLAAGLAAGSARADEPKAPPPPTTVPVEEPGPRDPSKGAWGAELGFSGSVNKPAGAIQLGLRRRVATHWTLGWDAEWNPWVSLYGQKTLRPGAFNTYGTVILRFPLAYEKINLRTTLNAGISYLLFDLYGSPKGSLGPYAAVSPLGLEWKLSRSLLLLVNPLSFSIPIPKLGGVPLTYPQYRINVGLGIMGG